jgi:hypothetical protein
VIRGDSGQVTSARNERDGPLQIEWSIIEFGAWVAEHGGERIYSPDILSGVRTN